MEGKRLVKAVMVGMVGGDRPHEGPTRRWSDDGAVGYRGCQTGTGQEVIEKNHCASTTE